MLGRVLLARFALLALISFMAIACAGGESPPDGSFGPTPDESFSGPTAAPAADVYLGPPPAQTPIPIREPSYLTEVIPPCTPVAGVPSNPCGQSPPIHSQGGGVGLTIDLGEEPRDYGYFVGEGETLADWVPHLVVRATTIPSTFRCDLGQSLRSHSYLNDDYLDSIIGYDYIVCYIDARANEYIIGSGPPTLTFIVDYENYFTYRQSEDDIEQVRSNMERMYIEGGELARRGGFISLFPLAPAEAVFFIAPGLNAAVEVWEVVYQWPVDKPHNGNVRIFHPDAGNWYSADRALYDQYLDTRISPTLDTFRTNLQAAYQTRMAETGGRILPATATKYLGMAQWPMLITDANQLQQFSIDVGNYDNPAGPPVRPSAPCGVGAVDDQVDNYGLMQDCSTLLALKDGIRGTASLNWAVDQAIADWDGVTLSSGDDDKRVVTLDLENESLTGTLSNRLGDLSGLTTLKLADNSLTGHIPASLADLDLDELKLSGNSFVGCIPAGLRDVGDHDLGSLGLVDCQTPPPDADSSLEFTSTAYQFSVAEDAALGTAVGALQARDTNPTRTLTYTIIMGNAAGKFAVGGASGAITVAAELDYETR